MMKEGNWLLSYHSPARAVGSHMRLPTVNYNNYMYTRYQRYPDSILLVDRIVVDTEHQSFLEG